MNEGKFETLSGLAKMESKDVALLFYEAGFDTFYTALSGCNESLRIAILANVSHRTREIMQEELERQVFSKVITKYNVIIARNKISYMAFAKNQTVLELFVQ